VVFVTPETRADPQGSGRLHGLPVALRFFQLEGP
jgi:hypothetical protein